MPEELTNKKSAEEDIELLPEVLEWDKLPLPKWQREWHTDIMARLIDTEECPTFALARTRAKEIIDETYEIAGVPQAYLKPLPAVKMIGRMSLHEDVVGDNPTPPIAESL